MTPERWQRIDDLLQETVNRPRRERAAFLDEVCADEEARREVESLISFHEQAGNFLEVPAFEAAASLLADQGESLVGFAVGPYRIEKLIGSGGMGEVYLAEDTKLDRKVAIKFLPPYMERDELAKRRLVREAKAAAKLDHPNICAMYEVAEEDGRSFIVMQHVEGETLAGRILRKPLELHKALDVGIEVTDAVAEAHSHGIIHRDIKPQNIVITRRGQVKVLDFGLAKVIQAAGPRQQNDRPVQSVLSTPGLIVGTAPYMSPEQAKGAPVDARSDLFSIGVVLYECIAGRRPFSGDTSIEICSQVIHVDPPPPSHLNPHVHSELDALIVKALAKEPNARYQSAGEMLVDLRAVRATVQAEDHVLTKPISPKPQTSNVRALATVANVWRGPRVRILAATLAALAILLIVVLRVPTWLRAAPQSPPPEAMQWYNQGTNALRNGMPYKASRALQRAVDVSDGFALAHARLAEAMTELDYSDKANQEIVSALRLVPDSSVLPKLEALYLQAITDIVSYHFDDAIKSYQEIARRVRGSEKAYAYVDLGRAYEKNDQIDEAIESYWKACELAPEDPAAFLRLGILYGRKQDPSNAEAAFQRATDIYEDQTNAEGIAEVLYQRGVFLYNLSRLAEARTELDQARDKALANGNKHQQIRTLLQLSKVYYVDGKTKPAEQYANQAMDLAKASSMENLSTQGLIDLGNTYLFRGNYDQAEKYLKTALNYAQQNKGRRNEANAMFSLGNLRVEQHDPEAAVSYIEQAVEFYEKRSYHKELSQAQILLARANSLRGDYDAALAIYRQLLQLARTINDQALIARAQGDVGNTLNQTEQYSGALAPLNESIEIYKSLNHSNAGYGLADLGDTLWRLGHYEEATESLRQASALADQSDATENLPLRAKVSVITANLMLSKRRFTDAVATATQALKLNADLEPEADAQYTLGLAQTFLGQTRAGISMCKDAVQTARRFNDVRLIPNAQLALAEALLDSGDARGALATALEAQARFARTSRQESEWRAWLVAGRASQQAGDFSKAGEYRSHARELLAGLEVTWGPEQYNFYLTRPDVQYYRQQLSQALDVNK